MCLLLQDLVQICLRGEAHVLPYPPPPPHVNSFVQGPAVINTHTNTHTREGGDIGGHVLRETTSRGLCGLVCPSRTSERGGEGDCVKEGGGGEGKCERERALDRLRCYSPGH
jgi:hypothetical protein